MASFFRLPQVDQYGEDMGEVIINIASIDYVEENQIHPVEGEPRMGSLVWTRMASFRFDMTIELFTEFLEGRS